jgi:hypothetical protein
MFRNLGSFSFPSVSSQYGETKAIKMNKNASAANVVATMPVLDFLPILVTSNNINHFHHLTGRWFQLIPTAATVAVTFFSAMS